MRPFDRSHAARKSMRLASCSVAFVVWWSVQNATAEDANFAYYAVSLADLKITEGTLPDFDGGDWRIWRATQAFPPVAVLDGEGEMILRMALSTNATPWAGPVETPNSVRFTDAAGQRRVIELPEVAIRAPRGKDVSGAIHFVPRLDAGKTSHVKFTLSSAKASPEARERFLAARIRQYEAYAASNRPGAAWFRFQALETRRILDGKERVEDVLATNPQPRSVRAFGPEREYEIFTGGRALSENLQLDRLLRPTKPGESDQPIDQLEGITVAEMNWAELTQGVDPPLDPLAAFVPFDQHALFLPSFPALLRLMDEADANGTPIAQLMQERAEDAGVRTRYQKQLCLAADALSRLLGETVIGAVAFTGGDPYLPTGSDVAVLFEAKSVDALTTAIAAKHAAALNAFPGCQAVKGTVGGVNYTGAVTPSRSVCSYLATFGKTVVVTNSLVQLERLANVSSGKEPSLASLPEYKFFRQRYPRGDADETGFLMVTDATLRRWCGPKWRIANSRRTRAAGIQAHHQAAHLDELVAGTAKPQRLTTDLHVPDLGTLDLTPDGVTSSTYGSLEFQTPIAELDLTKVTKDEAEAYKRWRDDYQRNWRQFFDPIGIRFVVKEKRLAADLTVMPLIASSEYRRYVNLVGKKRLPPHAGDPHPGTLFHWVSAFDSKSVSGFVSMVARGLNDGELTWMGDSIALYGDADPYWAELAKTENREEFFKNESYRLPIAFRADVTDAGKAARFMTALRTLLPPDATSVKTLQHAGREYVRITPKDTTFLTENFALHYAVMPKSLVVSLNEDVVKRAMDREAAEEKRAGAKPAEGTIEKPAAKDTPASGPTPWLGESMGLRLDRSAFEMMLRAGESQAQQVLQRRAWSAIPILNEWKRRYPNEDPVALHAKYWQVTLLCPGGGKYDWNETDRTMESTLYGHPGHPKDGPILPAALKSTTGADFGITFENQGLRARVEIERK